MKIAVNTRLLLKGRLEGIGRFSEESLRRIVQQHPEHQFYFLFDRPYDDSFIYAPNVTPVVCYPPARHPYLWYLFFEFGIPYQLRKIKPDIFLSTDGWIPLHLKDVKVVDVIHDLNFEYHQDFVKPVIQRYYKRFFHRFAEKSDRIATVSESAKMDIHKLYGIPLDEIDVVYNGCNENFRPISVDEQQSVKDRYSDGKDFFLFVGMIHKRKNLANIFRAFDEFKSKTASPMKLVVVGDKKWWHGEIEDTFNTMKFKKDVLFLGRQPLEVLSQLYAAARALVYVSFFEGFGIPIIEAFNAETAVITSNVTSMPEVAGDAAIFVDPHSVSQISDAMTTLCENESVRLSLIERGRFQKQRFSWQQTADRLWHCVEKVMAR